MNKMYSDEFNKYIKYKNKYSNNKSNNSKSTEVQIFGGSTNTSINTSIGSDFEKNRPIVKRHGANPVLIPPAFSNRHATASSLSTGSTPKHIFKSYELDQADQPAAINNKANLSNPFDRLSVKNPSKTSSANPYAYEIGTNSSTPDKELPSSQLRPALKSSNTPRHGTRKQVTIISSRPETASPGLTKR